MANSPTTAPDATPSPPPWAARWRDIAGREPAQIPPESLLAALRDEEPFVRLAAAQAAMTHADTRPYLVSLIGLMADSDPRARSYGEAALAGTTEPLVAIGGALPALRRGSRTHADPEVKRRCGELADRIQTALDKVPSVPKPVAAPEVDPSIKPTGAPERDPNVRPAEVPDPPAEQPANRWWPIRRKG